MTETETQRGGKAESLKCKLKLPGGLGRRGPAFPERREGRGRGVRKERAAPVPACSPVLVKAAWRLAH